MHRTLANPAGNQASLVVLPVFAVLQILIGSLYGRGLAKLLRLDLSSDAGKELAVCSTFANSGQCYPPPPTPDRPLSFT